MGLVIEIGYCCSWYRIYFVQEVNEEDAKKKVFKMFKETMSCSLPDTLEEAEEKENFFIDVLVEIDQIIL